VTVVPGESAARSECSSAGEARCAAAPRLCAEVHSASKHSTVSTVAETPVVRHVILDNFGKKSCIFFNLRVFIKE